MDLEPAAHRQGRESQLEKAIEVVLELLEQHPPPEHPRPPYPNYHQNGELGRK